MTRDLARAAMIALIALAAINLPGSADVSMFIGRVQGAEATAMPARSQDVRVGGTHLRATGTVEPRGAMGPVRSMLFVQSRPTP